MNDEIAPDDTEALLMAILAQLAGQDGQSDHQLNKCLGLGMSQLNRALVILASPPDQGGLGLLALHQDGKRRTLWLTDNARQLLNGATP